MNRLLLAVFALVVLGASAFAFAHPASADDTSLELHASLLAFDRASFSVASGANVNVTLYNDDNSIPHNIGLDVPDGAASKICFGSCTSKLSFVAPAPGTYELICTLHPTTMYVDLYVN